MRQPLTADRLQEFMKALAAEARTPSRVYLVGGASAVLFGWRNSTIDVDLKLNPETDEILRSLSPLKERLHINIELASPEDFIPVVPGWEDRSQFIQQQGQLTFYHYDFYAQALAKIERGHDIDRSDVDHFFEHGLVTPERLVESFTAIEDQIYKYPELNRDKFRRDVERVVQSVRDKRASD
jgi:hypothetical protein